MQLSMEEYARKRNHNGSSMQIENSITLVTVRHHWASIVKPNGYPRNGIFNQHLTTIKDSYMLLQNISNVKSWSFTHETVGPLAIRLTWMYSYEGYNQPKYCKCCMQEKLTFHLPWQLIKFSSLDLIHMVVRGLLKEHYCKAFVKITKVR